VLQKLFSKLVEIIGRKKWLKVGMLIFFRSFAIKVIDSIMFIVKTVVNIIFAGKDTYQEIVECDVLLLCHDVDRGDTREGLAYSKLIDSVDEDLKERGWRTAQLSTPGSLIKKTWGNSKTANRRFHLISLLTSGKKGKLIHSLMRLFYWKIKNLDYYREEEFFAELLKRIKVKCIIGIELRRSLCFAAKRANIPAVELLHGMGFPTIPYGWDTAGRNYIPSGFLSLDSLSTSSLKPLISEGISIWQINHPFYKRFNDFKAKKNLPKEWLNKPYWIPDKKKIILVSFTWGYDGELKDYAGVFQNGLMPEALIDAIRSSRENIFWLLRLHPVQLRKRFRYKKHMILLEKLVEENDNCEWEKSSISNLMHLINVCDGHVSMNSSTCYDFALANIPSLMLCPLLKKMPYFQDLKELGYVKLGELKTNKIIEWCLAVKKQEGYSVTKKCEWDDAVQWMLGDKCK
jgi:hypothetical protein